MPRYAVLRRALARSSATAMVLVTVGGVPASDAWTNRDPVEPTFECFRPSGRGRPTSPDCSLPERRRRVVLWDEALIVEPSDSAAVVMYATDKSRMRARMPTGRHG